MAWKFYQKLILIITLGFALFAFEAFIKYYLILNKVPKQGFYFFDQSRPWPGNFLQIIYTPNQNVAFSLPLPQILIIIMVIVILMVLSYLWWLSLFNKNLWQLTAFTLIILGALSNLIDRIIFGYVIDYINLFIWPVFNLADCMIVAGMIIYILSEFKRKNNETKKI
jgi:signal peptidase II